MQSGKFYLDIENWDNSFLRSEDDNDIEEEHSDGTDVECELKGDSSEPQ